MDHSRTISRWVLLAALLALLWVAAGLRLYRLPDLPVGLHYDEAANGVLAGEIARGLKRPIFIASYTGKEVLFFYWVALWMKILGVAPLALRLGAASIGLVTVAATAWTVYELFRDYTDGPWIALTAAAFLAVSFWHLVLSRYGFRAITQPLLQALTVAALWRGLLLDRDRGFRSVQIGWLVLAGVFCGLTAYTYLAARVFPVPLAAALVTLVAADRRGRRLRLAQAAIFIGVAALVLAPLAGYWLTHPGSFVTRARQVAAGSWSEAWSGLLACLKMFFLRGDPYIRFNVPERPLFGPFVAGLFVLGFGVGIRQLARWVTASGDPRRPRSLAAWTFLLLSMPVMLLPSALAAGEITPSNLRTVGMLPFIYAFPALGLWAILALLRHLFGQRTAVMRFFWPVACAVVLAVLGSSTASAYLAWASSSALYYAADGDLADIADYLNRMGNASDFSSTKPYVASQHYRHPTLAFLAQDYERVRWLVGGKTLVFPPDGDALFLFPRSASEDLARVRSMLPQDALVEAALGPDGAPAFHAYRGEITQAPMPAHKRESNLGKTAQLMGYAVTDRPRSGEAVEITIWWRVTGASDQPDYRPVARLADRWGSIWGEKQVSHYPSEQWTEGELIVDHLSIPIAPGAPPGDYAVRLEFYAPGADVRLPVLGESGAYAGIYVELPLHVDRAAKPPPIEDLNIDQRLDTAIDGLTLLGSRLDTTTVRPGGRLHATLFWRAGAVALPSHQLSLQLGETTVYQGAPVHDTYPFSKWAFGEIVADRYDPRLPLDMSPGKHRLRLQVGERAMVDLPLTVTVEATDRRFEVPPVSHSLAITFGRRVQLLGYDLSSDSVAPSETLTLTLTWRALTEMSTDYTVFTHLLAPDGSMTGQQDRQPVGGSYPTSLWARGEVVTDVYSIPVSDDAAAGDHRLEVGMYIAETGTRLSIEGQTDNAVTLQKVSVTE